MGQFRQCTMNHRQRIALCYCQASYRFVPDHSEKGFVSWINLENKLPDELVSLLLATL